MIKMELAAIVSEVPKGEMGYHTDSSDLPYESLPCFSPIARPIILQALGGTQEEQNLAYTQL